ncbi:hypothetical protein GCM10010315_15160 [Streptomyces luteosporeus]|uniref:Uncharacterized protein n=1 Tax=Streptomyces luteosporeus TaxID=173856 RepID=A0ABN3TQ72_9ACTN
MRRPGDQAATASGGHASAPTISVSSRGNRSGAPAGSDINTDGGRKACVIPLPDSSDSNSSPASCARSVATTNAAPDDNASSISRTDASKLSDAARSTRAPGRMPDRSPSPAASPAKP